MTTVREFREATRDYRKYRIIFALHKLQRERDRLPTAHILCKEIEEYMARNSALRRIEELKEVGIIHEVHIKTAEGKKSRFPSLELDSKVFQSISLLLFNSRFAVFLYKLIYEKIKKTDTIEIEKHTRMATTMCLMMMGRLMMLLIETDDQDVRDIVVEYGYTTIVALFESLSDKLKTREDREKAISHVKEVFGPHLSELDQESLKDFLAEAKYLEGMDMKTFLAKCV